MDLVTQISAYIRTVGINEQEIFKRKNQCTVICDICKDAKEGRPNNIPPETLRTILTELYFPGVENPAGELFNVIVAATQTVTAYAAGLQYLANMFQGNGEIDSINNISKSNHTNLHRCTPEQAVLFHEGGGKNPKDLKSYDAGDKIFETPAGPLDPGDNARSSEVLPGIYDFNGRDVRNVAEILIHGFYNNLENYGLPANITWRGALTGDVFSYVINLLGRRLNFDLSHPYNYQQLEGQDYYDFLQMLLSGNVQKNLYIRNNILIQLDLCKKMVIFKEMGDLMQVLVFIHALVLNNIPIRNVIFSTSDHVVFTQIRDLLGNPYFFNVIKDIYNYNVEIVHTGGRAGLQSGQMNLEIYRNKALNPVEKERREKMSSAKQIHQENFRQITILTEAMGNLQNIFWLNPNARQSRYPRPDGLTRGGFNAAQTRNLQRLFVFFIQQLTTNNEVLDTIISNIDASSLDADIKPLNSPILITKTKNVGGAPYFFISPDTDFSDSFYRALYLDMSGGTRQRKQYGGANIEQSQFDNDDIPKIKLIFYSCLASISYDDEPDGDEPFGKYGPPSIEKFILGDYLTEQGLLDEWYKTVGNTGFVNDMLSINFSLETLNGNNIYTKSIYEYITQNNFVSKIFLERPLNINIPQSNNTNRLRTPTSNQDILLIGMSAKISIDYNSLYLVRPAAYNTRNIISTMTLIQTPKKKNETD